MRLLRRMKWTELLVLGLLATLLTLLILPHPDNTLPASLLIPSGVSPTSPGENTVRLIFAGRRPDSQARGVELEFIVVNESDNAVWYRGYTLESFAWRPSLGTIHPLYRKQVQRDGQWRRAGALFCGNGVGKMRLRPGHAGKFSAYCRKDEPVVRIGFSHSVEGSDYQNVEQTVWSKPIPYRSELH